MSTELDELEEIDLAAHSTRGPRRSRQLRRLLGAAMQKSFDRPKWAKQLSRAKVGASQKLKAKVTV